MQRRCWQAGEFPTKQAAWTKHNGYGRHEKRYLFLLLSGLDIPEFKDGGLTGRGIFECC